MFGRKKVVMDEVEISGELDQLYKRKKELDNQEKSEDRDREARGVRAKIRKLGGSGNTAVRGRPRSRHEAPESSDSENHYAPATEKQKTQVRQLEDQLAICENKIAEVMLHISAWLDERQLKEVKGILS